MMDYNLELLQLLHNMTPAYHELRKRWPQINAATRIKYIESASILLASWPDYQPHYPVRYYNKSGLRWAFVRAIGGLLRRDGWVRRGKFADIYPPPVNEHREEIRLERFTYSNYDGTIYRMAAGYHAASDTLYVRK